MNDQDSQFDSLLPPLKLDRRGFIATSVAAGFSLAAGQAVAQTAIATDAAGLLAGRVDIPVADGKMPAYRAAPQGKKNLPTLLVVSEIFGVHEYIQDICRRLAHLGYLAVAPEAVRAPGRPVALHRYSQAAGGNHQQGARRAGAARPGRRIGLGRRAWRRRGPTGHPGFCWGGRQVWLYAAHNPKLRAGAAWYGQLGGEPSELKPRPVLSAVGDLKAPVLGAYGGKDAGIALADVDRMRVALAQGPAAAKASRIDIYPEAPHAFHADYRPSYRKAEADQAWQRMLDWFKQNGL